MKVFLGTKKLLKMSSFFVPFGVINYFLASFASLKLSVIR